MPKFLVITKATIEIQHLIEADNKQHLYDTYIEDNLPEILDQPWDSDFDVEVRNGKVIKVELWGEK